MSYPVAKKFIYENVVKENQIDVFGHMNNVYYVQMFEDARWKLGDESGFGREWAHEVKQGLIVIDFYIRFRKEVKLHERIRVESEVLEYRKKLVKLEQNLFGEQGQLACNALVTLALFDINERKIVACPDDWHDRVGLTRGARI